MEMRETAKIAAEIVKCGVHRGERCYLAFSWHGTRKAHGHLGREPETRQKNASKRASGHH